MPAMKVTISAAMRARDVSRPRPEHLAEAEASEADWTGVTDGPRVAGSAATDVATGGLDAAEYGVDPPADVRQPGRSEGRAGRRYHARRRRRGSGGGGSAR